MVLLLLTDRNGFPEERIEAVLHKDEVMTKHQRKNDGVNLLLVRMFGTVFSLKMLTTCN